MKLDELERIIGDISYSISEKSMLIKALIAKKSAYNINIKRARAKGKVSENEAEVPVIDDLIRRLGGLK